MAKRCDGIRVKDQDPIMKIMPYFMYDRIDALNYNFEEIDCALLDKYIKGYTASELSYMHVLIATFVRTMHKFPQLNRFVVNGKMYEHKDITMSFTVHRSLRGETAETVLKASFQGTETIAEVAAVLDKAIAETTALGETNDTDDLAKIIMSIPSFLYRPVVKFLMWMDRHNILPKDMIDASPFHTSFYITNLKSLGIGTVLHHIYNFGTCSQFVSMGKERYIPIVDNKEHITIKKMMQLGLTTDERICDGLYFARAVRYMKKLLTHPEMLEQNIE
jgi:pyruvate/2-oxoglutarate dehydrogenase complex dihydrolipoamide acyltransferase (E2) component